MLETGLKISYKNTYTKLAFEKCIINGIVQKKTVKASTQQMGKTKLIPLLSIIVYLINTQSSF